MKNNDILGLYNDGLLYDPASKYFPLEGLLKSSENQHKMGRSG
jgi:hypothetical protein